MSPLSSAILIGWAGEIALGGLVLTLIWLALVASGVD